MWQVVLGRVISGAGASGMAGLVSILITGKIARNTILQTGKLTAPTDLLPLREVAQWRAYVNLVATLGRSIGGPLGGWLVDVIGWRW
jgi:MFS family permease